MDAAPRSGDRVPVDPPETAAARQARIAWEAADPAWIGADGLVPAGSDVGAIERLREFPCLYLVVDHPGARRMPGPGGGRAFYEIKPDTGRNDDAGDVVMLRVYRLSVDTLLSKPKHDHVNNRLGARCLGCDPEPFERPTLS